MRFGLAGTASLGDEPLFGPLTLDLPTRWTCLLGPSGAGKTTVPRPLSGVPTQVRSNGQTTTPDHVADTAQDDLLQPRLSVLSNILIGQHLREQRPDKTRGLALVASVGVAGFASRSPESQ